MDNKNYNASPFDMNFTSSSSPSGIHSQSKEERLRIVKKGVQFKKLKAKRNPFPSENKSLSSLLSDKLSLTDCDSTMSSSTSGMSATLQPPTKNRDEQMVKAVHSNQNNSKTSRGDIEASGNVRPKTILCTLCNYKFDEKQVICFSYNPYCKHVFHAICMIDYLMKGCDTCPICNNWFLKIE